MISLVSYPGESRNTPGHLVQMKPVNLSVRWMTRLESRCYLFLFALACFRRFHAGYIHLLQVLKSDYFGFVQFYSMQLKNIALIGNSVFLFVSF